MNQIPAVFFDRDGTLMEEVHYCNDPQKVHAFEGVKDALRLLHARGFLVVVITNQSGIGRGRITMEQYEAVHEELLGQLDHQIDATYFCPEAPEGASKRRKPGIGMIQEAIKEFGMDSGSSWMVGDRDADILCGKAAGLRTVLVRTGYGSAANGELPDFTVPNVVSAIDTILRESKI